MPAANEKWLTPGVVSVGLSSLFSDSGHEIVTAILPSFLTTVLGGSAASLGVIEGISDALTGTTKVLGGPLADDPRRRGRMAGGGYLVTAVATGSIGLAAAVWQAGVFRGLAWAARGFRSPARDSLLASLATPGTAGRAFGVERAGDNLGAVIGPLLAGILVIWVGIRPTMFLAAVPGLFAAVAIGFAARAATKLRTASMTTDVTGSDASPAGSMRTRLFAGYRQLRGTGLTRALVPVGLFEAGNVAATILILRGNELLLAAGYSWAAAVSITTILYAAHNAAAAGMSSIAGSVIDRRGTRFGLMIGVALYLVAYLGFAAGPENWVGIGAFFVLGGCGIGWIETAESTLVAGMLPDRVRGSGFGMLGLVQAGGDLVATVIGGILYTVISPAACFIYAASWMALSLISQASVRGSKNGGMRSSVHGA